MCRKLMGSVRSDISWGGRYKGSSRQRNWDVVRVTNESLANLLESILVIVTMLNCSPWGKGSDLIIPEFICHYDVRLSWKRVYCVWGSLL